MMVEKPDQLGGEVMNVEDLENESSVGPPPTKKSRLDYEAIIMGEMLSDIHINLAQSVLKVQAEWIRKYPIPRKGSEMD